MNTDFPPLTKTSSPSKQQRQRQQRDESKQQPNTVVEITQETVEVFRQICLMMLLTIFFWREEICVTTTKTKKKGKVCIQRRCQSLLSFLIDFKNTFHVFWNLEGFEYPSQITGNEYFESFPPLFAHLFRISPNEVNGKTYFNGRPALEVPVNSFNSSKHTRGSNRSAYVTGASPTDTKHFKYIGHLMMCIVHCMIDPSLCPKFFSFIVENSAELRVQFDNSEFIQNMSIDEQKALFSQIFSFKYPTMKKLEDGTYVNKTDDEKDPVLERMTNEFRAWTKTETPMDDATKQPLLRCITVVMVNSFSFLMSHQERLDLTFDVVKSFVLLMMKCNRKVDKKCFKFIKQVLMSFVSDGMNAIECFNTILEQTNNFTSLDIEISHEGITSDMLTNLFETMRHSQLTNGGFIDTFLNVLRMTNAEFRIMEETELFVKYNEYLQLRTNEVYDYFTGLGLPNDSEDPEDESKDESNGEPGSQLVPEPEPVSQLDPESEPGSQLDPESESKDKSKDKSKDESKDKSGSQLVSEPEPGSQLVPESEPVSQLVPEPEPESESKDKSKDKSKDESKDKSKDESVSEPVFEPVSEPDYSTIFEHVQRDTSYSGTICELITNKLMMLTPDEYKMFKIDEESRNQMIKDAFEVVTNPPTMSQNGPPMMSQYNPPMMLQYGLSMMPQTFNGNGGYYDGNGGYYDGNGGYYDGNGGYYDVNGGYYDVNGDYYGDDYGDGYGDSAY